MTNGKRNTASTFIKMDWEKFGVRPMPFVPLTLSIALFLLSFLPRVQENIVLVRSFWGASGALLIWISILCLKLRSSGEKRTFTASIHKHHYIQAMVHLSVYFYWGVYWEPVTHHAWLLVAQLVFAYAVDMLLSWSRRETYLLGFGPFPIIFSTNLFLWFRDDWFYMQFLMVLVGFMGKEFVRWNREGRRVHIFNPSAFTLGLFSIVLIVTNTTHLTWGQEIASTLTLAPGIYTYLFLAGLVVMYFFSITLVAASAAITLFTLSALYFAFYEVPYFLDSEIPTAVFLGLHLLVTDPSTSPRTPLGKLIFGTLYGLGVFFLYSVLGRLGIYTFYDKLLCVPLLNLSVQLIDRFARNLHENTLLSRINFHAKRSGANLTHMAVWISFFAVMSVLGRTDSRHIGDMLPFWEEACVQGKVRSCERLLLLKTTYCNDGSGWACNEVGAHYFKTNQEERALTFFSRGCELRYQASCLNFLEPMTVNLSNPHELDLRLLLREGGLNLLEMPVDKLYARACDHGWRFACDTAASI